MDNPQITIEQGVLKGRTNTDFNGKKYHSFFGIPYAKPPIGTLRFKAPQPPAKWTGVRDAIQDTGACYARDDLQPNIIMGSEDCLVLNVYIPELPNSKIALKPVMLWIHGGGFVAGSNNTKEYGPQFLISEDVVIVAINYRLGCLGFLVVDDPALGVPGNAGLKDMVMALKWVQNNIKYFGGDPNNVTIFGESAGGASVHLLMLSPMAKGLFHKAISQSGCALNPWVFCRSSAKELAQALNCPFTKDADMLSFLQSLPVEQLYEGQLTLKDDMKLSRIRPIGPVVEKVVPNEPAFLSENPLDILKKGNYNKVPLIMGYNNGEGLLFAIPGTAYNVPMETDFEEFIPPSLKLERGSNKSKTVAEKIRKFYYGNVEPSEETKATQCDIQSDAFFNHGIQQCIKHHALTSSQHLYFYRFTFEGILNYVKALGKLEMPGASHGDELGYLFRTYGTPDDLALDSKEVKVVRRMTKLWTNFAKTGNPNLVEDVTWTPVTREKLVCLEIGENLKVVVNPDRERMEFWDNILK